MTHPDEAPTVVMTMPLALEPEPDSGAVTIVRPAVIPSEASTGLAVPGKACEVDDAHGAEGLEVGGDDAFILAWGRGHEALRSRSRQLVLSMALNGCLAGVVGFLAWRNEHKETYVFVRDSLGNVVQADALGFLRAGDRRSEVEIKGFVRHWVTDAFTWTPLDVEDRLRAALRVVDGRAQAVVKAGLRLAERRALVENGTSGRVWDEPRTGREPQVVIERNDPLEVLVAFDRHLVDSGGAREEAGGLFARVTLQEVPRSPSNPYGLVIVDARISERL